MNDTTRFYLHFFMPALFVVLAGIFILVALKTLVSRRPLLFSSRWLFGLMCVAFLPAISNSFVFGWPGKHLNLITWVSPAMFVVILISFWIQMRGYMAIAISDTYFREALLSSAASLGYTIEETMSRLKIKETGEEMQVAIQGWTGTAQLKSANRKSSVSLGNIVTGMKEYFTTHPGKMNYLTSYLYLIIGAFMMVLAVSMFTLRWK